MNIERYADRFPTLKFKEEDKGILDIIFGTRAPMNPMNTEMHNKITYVWRDIDLNRSIQSVLIRGVGKGFSALIWSHLCGMAKAKYYLLTGKPVTGELI